MRYLATLLGVALLSAPLLYFTGFTVPVSACRSLQQPGAYLAYCAHPLFGSYEHEAYRFGLEPEAVDAVRRTQVLFLGNSRLQFGFSTTAADTFFGARQVSYHLLGFGYGESSVFARVLLDRIGPSPRMVVINADPFFAGTLSSPAYDTVRAPLASFADGVVKHLFDRAHPLLCRIPGLCVETFAATYRDRRTGQWIWHGVLMPAGTVAQSITDQKGSAWSPADLPAWQRTAEAFLDRLPVPRACIVLTGVPTPHADSEGMATALAARLGLPLILPLVPDLTSSDDSHLSAESAERWSAAFLAQAAPLIESCVGPERKLASG